MDKKRRNLLKGGVVAGGLGAFAAGYLEPLSKAAVGLVKGTSGEPTLDKIVGNALPPEFRIDPTTGALECAEGQVVSLTQCFGCWSICGIRARVDTANNRILRIAGNPYHPLSHENPEAYETPVRDAYARLGGDSGLKGRSTACARGAAMLEQLQSPHRITQVLKRVGPRGAGQWQTISFEQLIEEVVEGGDLFGEGHVDGLRAIYDHETPVDPDNPEYGPRANQLLVTNAGNEGREAFVQRFAFNAFGTRNFGAHGSYCGLGYRAGSGALLDDLDRNAHAKPDWEHVRFALFWGTAPAQAGNPYKLQGRLLATARTERTFEYVVISPSLPNSSSLATQPTNTWLPVRPGTDSALAMAMIRWIIDNERYDARYLAQPGPAAMEAAGEPSWSNATHLVISEPDHPDEGRLLRGKDLGWRDAEAFVVMDAASGAWVPHTQEAPAELFVDAMIEVDGQPVRVKSSLQRLAEEARRKTIEEYAAICGVPAATIAALAEKFTSYGKQAVVNSHGGVMNGNSFYTAYSILMLNALVGNLNAKGGTFVSDGAFPSMTAGARYDLQRFPGMRTPKGVFFSRNRFPYERSSEYRRKIEAGENPYPAKAPWFPFSGALLTEHLASALEGYPYPAKVWINHMANPIYGQAGLRAAIDEKLRDPKRIGLIVSIDPFINETTAYADYVVPDTLTYESWGFTAPWAGVQQKASTARWPVVESPNARTADGQPVCMESFMIAVAKRLGLPGFGDNAIQAADGTLHPLHTAEDYYLRAAANVAFAGKPVPEVSDDDLQVTGVSRVRDRLERTLDAEEWRRVAFVYTRGGRFAPKPAADAPMPPRRWERGVCIWNERVGTVRHSMTGERLSGCPTWYPLRFADGSPMEAHYPEQEWPFRLSSHKSHLQSAMSIGSARLRQIHPFNPVGISRQDAERLGIQSGDRVRLVTPGGQAEAVAQVRDGVIPGAIIIEHGFGHRELGAREHIIDGKPLPADPAIGAGVNLNDLGLVDPTREISNAWTDWVTGAAVRQALPAKIEKIA